MVAGKNREARGSDSFIVEAFLYCIEGGRIFTLGRWLPFNWFLVDLYVVIWTIVSITVYALLQVIGFTSFLLVIVSGFLGMLRVYEIVLFHAVETLRRDSFRVRSPQRSLILVLINYLEIVIWFAVFYSAFKIDGLITVEAPVSVAILRESLALMLSNSYGHMKLNGNLIPFMVTTIQSLVGLFLILVVVTRFVSLLPQPGSHEMEND